MILAGDLGGTHLRFACIDSPAAAPALARSYPAAQCAGIEDALQRFLGEAGAPRPAAACFGVAGPVSEGRVRMTNLGWTLDAAALGARFGLPGLRLVNDFDAAARGLAWVAPQALVTLQAGEPLEDAAQVLLGAGTGLGIALIVRGPTGVRPIPGEGGHAAFAPADAQQAELWQWLHARHGRVTLEHVLSGAGLERIYGFLAGQGRFAQPPALRAAAGGATPKAAEISRHALELDDPLCLAALDLYIACYGACAGDLALTAMARGGVFVGGGIAQAILPRLAAGGFVSAFNDKGAFAEHARRVPVAVVTDPDLGLRGAAAAALEP